MKDTAKHPSGWAVGTGPVLPAWLSSGFLWQLLCLFQWFLFLCLLCVCCGHLELCVMSSRLGGRPMLAPGISWAARSLSDSWGVQVMLGGRACFQQDSVWSTQTGLQMCGNPCRAELRSTVAGAFMSFSLLGIRVSGPWSSEVCSYLHPYPRILPTHISFCFLLPPSHPPPILI